ncbi:hypothetical protein N8198_05680 [Gammaproteobacteria bacterium]|jgi:hypothetical protein|nr:hypothetical protein [Gammaproteobacteria bacterium]
MSEAAIKSFDLFATDASGQRKFSINNFPRSAKIRDLIKALVPKMGLNTTDTVGRPLDYQVFSKRESCHLRGSDSVGKTLQDGDEISLLPDIQAG